jgi:hypothetical protein
MALVPFAARKILQKVDPVVAANCGSQWLSALRRRLEFLKKGSVLRSCVSFRKRNSWQPDAVKLRRQAQKRNARCVRAGRRTRASVAVSLTFRAVENRTPTRFHFGVVQV